MLGAGDQLEQLRAAERRRATQARGARLAFVLALLPLGGALTLAAMYITLPAVLAERESYTTIGRPALGPFLGVAAAPVVAGVLLAAASAFVVTEVMSGIADRTKQTLVLATTAGLYGVFVPLTTALVTPLSLFIGGLFQPAGHEALADRLFVAAFSTPLHVFTYWAVGLYGGLIAGAAMFVGGLVAFSALRPGSPATPSFRPLYVSAGFALFTVAAVLFGPHAVYESLVRAAGGR